MARRPKFRKSSSLIPRIISAAILVPLSLWIVYLGPPYSLVLGGIVAIAIAIEWGMLCAKLKFSLFPKLVCILLGTLYLTIAVLWLFQTLLTPEGWKIMYWLFFLVWSADTAAFAGGKLLKGPKLVPAISPNKTWSGFATAMIVGTAISYETSFWLFPGVFNLGGIACLVLIAQGGDLLESQVKRWSDTKDSGSLIPGHGGMLDRLDSLLAVSFALALWQMMY